jgi:signal transduction histidine kinase
MDRSTSRLSQWVYYLAASLYYIAVFLRTILIYRDSPELTRALVLLLVVLVLFISEPAISRNWSRYFPIYLLLQTLLLVVLLALPGYPDFFAVLLGIFSMQVMLNLNPRIGAVWIAAFVLIMGLLLTKNDNYGASQAVALTLIYTAGNVFFGTYALVIRREQATQDQRLQLARELQATNQQLQDYSAQLEDLAVARERTRFARELHDSVTQTVFSMTLTTQSALLLFERDPILVNDQLERLSQLVHGALAEMQTLISELKPERGGVPGLVPALRRHLADNRIADNLSVSLQVEGEPSLTFTEEQALLGIAQEALNNILKHARTHEAHIRLHMAEPCWMEIEDQGLGFDLHKARNSDRMGLVSMQERATEIGWDLQVITSPGAGTCIRVESVPVSEVQE